MKKTSFMRVATFAFILFAALSCNAEEAPQPEKYQAGTHYTVLEDPVRTRNPNKVEVVEAFWYGCGHCYNFEPSLQPWVKNLPDDVDFIHMPAMWHNDMVLHAKMYYTAKQLNLIDQMHAAFFTAMHVEKKRFKNEAEIAKFFADFGIDEETFNKTFNSFSVSSLVKQAEAKASAYKITGTPEMIVNGKYHISARLAGSQPNMLKVASYLIEKERQAMAAAKQ